MSVPNHRSAGRRAIEGTSHGVAIGSRLWAAGAGVITAVAVFVALPDRSVPLTLIGLVAGRDVRSVDVHGGVKITYRAPARDAVGSAGEGDVLTQAARILQRRAAQIGNADVLVADREISIEVAGVAPGSGHTVAHTLSSHGELTFHRVMAAGERMRALCRRAEVGADTQVSCEQEHWWHEETGREMHDVYLAAPDPDALERFLARAAADDPALAPEPGRELLFEPVRPDLVFSGDRAPFWRTYYVEARSELDGDDIAEAYVYWDPASNRPAVIVRFDDAGAARLQALTRANVGGKMAIVLDGTVMSAPVIQDVIPGGRVTITMGGASRAQVESEAHALAAVLQNRATGEPLPVALEVVATVPIVSTVTPEQRDRAARLLAFLAGLAAFVLVRVIEHRAPRLDVALPGPAGGRPWGRLAVTVAALAVVYAGPSFVPLPGTEGLAELLLGDSGLRDGQLSVFALGITPFLSAFLLVELMALLVPRWRPLRTGGLLSRARLTRATIILSVLFALVQGWFVATWLIGFAARNGLLALPPGLAIDALVTLTLTGGVLVLWILAGLVSRHGLGNGISVILLAGAIGVPASLRSMGEATTPGVEEGGTIALLGIAVCAVIAVTSRVLRSRAGGPLGLRLPTCGILPVVEAGALMALPAPLLVVSGATAWLPDGLVIRLALVAALAVVFSLLFSWPGLAAGHVRAVDADAAARRVDAFWGATAMSAAYVVGVAGLGWLMLRWYPRFAHDVLWMVLSTAIGMDILAEWRARRRCRELVAVWPVHRVQVADLAVRALQGAGIGAHTRGRYHRSLLYFFGPFVPIEIMVPAARAGEAADLLRNVLGGDVAGAAAGESDAGSADAHVGATALTS